MLVVGIANVQTAVPVDGFPIAYSPARYLPGRIDTTVAGVGFTVARVLRALAPAIWAVELAAPLGSDLPADAVLAEANRLGIGTRHCVTSLAATPRSVVLYAADGRRQIHTDLGEALTHTFDAVALAHSSPAPAAAVVGNLDFSRPVLAALQARHVPVVVDLQDVQGPDNPYDQEFLTADVIVMSHERLGTDPGEFLRTIHARSAAGLSVLTLGAQGCLAIDQRFGEPWHQPAFALPGAQHAGVLNTTGAGDAFTAGLTYHLFGLGDPPRAAVARACAVAATALAGHGGP